MSRKRLYLHIGTHKTGTTTVQWTAAQNRSFLAERDILYPYAGCPPAPGPAAGHHLLAWSMRPYVGPPHFPDGPRGAVQVWESLLAEIESSRCGAVLISSEEFDVLNDEAVGRIAERLAAFDTRIICYLRRLDQFIQAMYATSVLYENEQRDIESFISRMRTKPHFLDLLEPWLRHFGRENIAVLPYRADFDAGWDVVSDLFGILGITADALADPGLAKQQNKNRTPPWYIIDTIRFLRASGCSQETMSDYKHIMNDAKAMRVSGASHELLSPTERRRWASLGWEQARELFTQPVDTDFANWFRGAAIADDETWSTRHGPAGGLETSFTLLREWMTKRKTT